MIESYLHKLAILNVWLFWECTIYRYDGICVCVVFVFVFVLCMCCVCLWQAWWYAAAAAAPDISLQQTQEKQLRTSWERNFVWKRSAECSNCLIMGIITFFLFAWPKTYLRLVEVGPGLVEPSSGVWNHLLKDSEPPDPCLDWNHCFWKVFDPGAPGYAPSISCNLLMNSLWTWSDPNPASALSSRTSHGRPSVTVAQCGSAASDGKRLKEESQDAILAQPEGLRCRAGSPRWAGPPQTRQSSRASERCPAFQRCLQRGIKMLRIHSWKTGKS